ncbi:hypothetical protein GW17_00043856 [Ensete ventricosum]|uniref:Uncharacterized protein n=1 Tax=Ensete ventricosum TaxID=4639 RepID=A0A444D682_ENSVE|nr:hypothetical protein GW17_00043856 [Ensete ventricosum]RZR74748.1 hypothetical protein BHM03_00042426 [Ensete ventricosum]
MEDGLLKISRDLEVAQVKVREAEEALHPNLREAKVWETEEVRKAVKKAIINYKESSGFKLGLQRSGQVSYEYGYWVALA